MGSSNSSAAKVPPTEQVPFGPDGLKPADYPTNDRKQHGVPVFLNVYNLQDTTQGGRKKKGSTFNESVGFGFYHSGVEILGVEWSFGGHPELPPTQPGIFPVRPKTALPAHQFHTQIRLGEIVGLTQQKVATVLKKMEKDWYAVSYHLMSHNCNSFGEAFVAALNKEFNVKPAMEVPSWVNRAARFGDVVVPDRIYKAMMRRAPQPPQGNTGSYNQSTPPPQPQASSGGSRQAAPPEEEVPKIPIATREEMSKMSIKEIKTMMWVNGISWDGCFEKGDLIDAVERYRAEHEE